MSSNFAEEDGEYLQPVAAAAEQVHHHKQQQQQQQKVDHEDQLLEEQLQHLEQEELLQNDDADADHRAAAVAAMDEDENKNNNSVNNSFANVAPLFIPTPPTAALDTRKVSISSAAPRRMSAAYSTTTTSSNNNNNNVNDNNNNNNIAAASASASAGGGMAEAGSKTSKLVQINNGQSSSRPSGGRNNRNKNSSPSQADRQRSVSPRMLEQRAQMHLLRRKLLPVIGLRRFQHARRLQRESIVAQLTAAEAAQAEHLQRIRNTFDNVQQGAVSDDAHRQQRQLSLSAPAPQLASVPQTATFITEGEPISPKRSLLAQRLLCNATRDTVAAGILDHATHLRHWGRAALEELVTGEKAALERFALPDEVIVYPNEMASSHGLILLLHGTMVKIPVPAPNVMKQHFAYLSAVQNIVNAHTNNPANTTNNNNNNINNNNSKSNSSMISPAQLTAELIRMGAPTKSPLNLNASMAVQNAAGHHHHHHHHHHFDSSTLPVSAAAAATAASSSTLSSGMPEVFRAPAVIGETLILSETLSNYWLKAETYCQFVVISGPAIHRALLQQPRSVILRTLSSDILTAREVALRAHFSQTPPLLRRSWITKDMEVKTLYRLMLDLQPRSFPPGEEIATEGATAPWMVFIRRGEAELLSNGIHVMKQTAGDTFGEMSVLFGEPRLNTLRSTTICDVWILHRRSVGNVLRMADSQRSVVRKAAAMRRVLLEQLPRVHSHQPLREVVPYLRGMPDPIFEEMVQHSKAHVFPVGLLMVASSETCDALVLIVNGTALEQDVRRKKHGAGDVLGINCLIPHRWVYGISAATMVDSFILARKHIMHALSVWGTVKQALMFVHLEMKELKRHLSKTLLLNPPVSNIATSTVTERKALRSVLDGAYMDGEDARQEAAALVGASSSSSSSLTPFSATRRNQRGQRSQYPEGVSQEVIEMMKTGNNNNNNNNNNANDDDDAAADDSAAAKSAGSLRGLSYEERMQRRLIAAKRQRFKLRTQGSFATKIVALEDNPFKRQINNIVGNQFFEKAGWTRDEKKKNPSSASSLQLHAQLHSATTTATAAPPSGSLIAAATVSTSASSGNNNNYLFNNSGRLSPNNNNNHHNHSGSIAGSSSGANRRISAVNSGAFRPLSTAVLTMSPLQDPKDFRKQLNTEHDNVAKRLQNRGAIQNVINAVEEAEANAAALAALLQQQQKISENNGDELVSVMSSGGTFINNNLIGSTNTNSNAINSGTAISSSVGGSGTVGGSGSGVSASASASASSALPMGLSDDDISMLGSLRTIWADPRYDRPFMDRVDVAGAIAPWPSVSHVYWLNQRSRDEDPQRAVKRAQSAAVLREQLLVEAAESPVDDPQLVKRDAVTLPARLKVIQQQHQDGSTSLEVVRSENSGLGSSNRDDSNSNASGGILPGMFSFAKNPRPSVSEMTRRLSLVPPGAEQQVQYEQLRRRSSLIQAAMMKGALGSFTSNINKNDSSSNNNNNNNDPISRTSTHYRSHSNSSCVSDDHANNNNTFNNTLSSTGSQMDLLPYSQRPRPSKKNYEPLVTDDEVEQVLGAILAKVPARVRTQFEMDEEDDSKVFIGSATHRMNAQSSLNWLPSECNRDFLNEAIEDLSLTLSLQIPAPRAVVHYDEAICNSIPTRADFRREQAALIAAKKATADLAALLEANKNNNNQAANNNSNNAGGGGAGGGGGGGVGHAGTGEPDAAGKADGGDDEEEQERLLQMQQKAQSAPVPRYAQATGSSIAKKMAMMRGQRSHAEVVAMTMQRSGLAHSSGCGPGGSGGVGGDGSGRGGPGGAGGESLVGGGGGMFSMRSIIKGRQLKGGLNNNNSNNNDDDDDDDDDDEEELDDAETTDTDVVTTESESSEYETDTDDEGGVEPASGRYSKSGSSRRSTPSSRRRSSPLGGADAAAAFNLDADGNVIKQQEYSASSPAAASVKKRRRKKKKKKSESLQAQRRLTGEDKEKEKKKKKKREKEAKRQNKAMERGLVPQPPRSKNGRALLGRLVLPGLNSNSNSNSNNNNISVPTQQKLQHPATSSSKADAAATPLPPVAAASYQQQQQQYHKYQHPRPRQAEDDEPAAAASSSSEQRAQTARSSATAGGASARVTMMMTPALRALESKVKKLPEIKSARPVYSARVGYCMVPASAKSKLSSTAGIPKHRVDAVSSMASSLSRASDL